MDNSEFHHLADQLMLKIEDAIENFNGNTDIDYEMNGSVMMLSIKNRSKIIINRQEPVHQIWLAAKANGYHFNCCADGSWVCSRSGQNFYQVLTNEASKEAGETISFL